MRILHVSKVTGIAGSEGHLLRLLRGLAANELDVQLAILEDPRYPVDSFFAAIQNSNILTYRIPIQFHVDLRTLSQLKSLFQHTRPDIIHTHLFHADLYGLIAARQAGIRVAISTRHNNDKFRRNPIFKIANRRIMRLADKVVVISNALCSFVAEVEGIHADKIVTIPYGLEPPPENRGEAVRESSRADLGYSSEEEVIGIFGRLIEQKGVDVLLNAFEAIYRQHPQARLLIVGDGPDRKALERQANQLGLEKVTHFTGWIDQAQRLMPACDMIVVPSRWEGFGLVTLEAMGWELPIIASRTSSLPEIIRDRETGLLVPSENVEALASAISLLLQNPEYAKKLGQSGYERLITDFSVDRMVCATLDLYQKLVERD